MGNWEATSTMIWL